MHDTLSKASDFLSLLNQLMVPLGAILGFILTALRVRQDRQGSVTRAMETAGVIVQDLDREVRALKDPNKPGEWNREAEISLLNRAIDLLLNVASKDIDVVRGLWGENLDKTEIARRLIEANVTILKAKIQAAAPPATAPAAQGVVVSPPSA